MATVPKYLTGWEPTGVASNSKNSISQLARYFMGQGPIAGMTSYANFIPGLESLAQRNLLSGLGDQNYQTQLQNSVLGNMIAQQNQARAQGLPFNPMDYQTTAGMNMNAGMRDWLGNAVARRGALISGYQSPAMGAFGALAGMGAPQINTPKQPGFLSQLAGVAGQAFGMGWNPFGGGAQVASFDPNQYAGQQMGPPDPSKYWSFAQPFGWRG